MSTIDYTPVILAQLTDLATRVTQLEHANYALRKEVQRLSLPSFGFQEKNPFASPFLDLPPMRLLLPRLLLIPSRVDLVSNQPLSKCLFPLPPPPPPL